MGIRRSIDRAVMACCLLAVPGCLSGSYTKVHTASLERYREAGELQRLHTEPKTLAGGRLRVRVPKLFTKEASDKPPILDDLPGFCCTAQELLDAGGDGAKMPVTLSIWAPVDDASGGEDVKKRILSQIQGRKDPGFANASWTNVDVPRGVPSSWAVMTLQGQQPFDRFAAGEGGVRESKSTEGTTAIWVAADTTSKVCAVLMWRVPQELAATTGLGDLASLVARNVEMKPPEPAAPPEEPAANPPPKQP